MASSAIKFSLFLVLTLFSSLHIHARDSHFFNKIPSTTNNVLVPTATTTTTDSTTQQEQPNFLPQNEDSYGLYGHESGQNPPSTAATTTTTTTDEFKQPTNKYLPKNYNPVAYVTVPEDSTDATTFSDERTFTTNTNTNKNIPNNLDNNNNNNNNDNNYYNGAQNYYNNQQPLDEAAEFRNYPSASNNNNYYYNGGSSFNSQPQGESRYSGAVDSFQPQGMSDTRYMENGKYFYDINSEKYSANHPYETLRGSRVQNQNQNEYSNNKNFYGNNGYEFNGDNSMGGYQNRPQDFQDEENMP